MPDKRPYGPFLYKGTFQVNEEPKDTFLHMKNWTKGVCFINGHNLGRYWIKGPQETLYIPAPWLYKGENEVSMGVETKGMTSANQTIDKQRNQPMKTRSKHT